MKKTMLIAMSLTIAAQSAHALDTQSIQAAQQQSQAEVNAATAGLTAEQLALVEEISTLQGQISVKEQEIASSRTARNISLVVSGVLAVTAFGFRIGADKAPNMWAMGGRVIGFIASGIGAAGTAAYGGYSHYQVVIKSEDLVELKARLKGLKEKLTGQAQ